MKTRKQKLLVGSFLALLLIVLTISRVRIANERNFTLAKGETIPGLLLIMGQNAELEEGSFVKGPLIMLCCNLIVNGRSERRCFFDIGNLKVKVKQM
ncbi:MAG: hypothetical protein IPO36_13390 [Anaerolineales bacterium]|nr:hypothetical protein [Anaerolineales bacterium]